MNQEQSLAKLRSMAGQNGDSLPPPSAATAPAYFIAEFDRAMVGKHGTFPQIPPTAAWYVFEYDFNDGGSTKGCLLIFADPENMLIYTYSAHPFAGLRGQGKEDANAMSTDTTWHLYHVATELKGGDVRKVEA